MKPVKQQIGIYNTNKVWDKINKYLNMSIIDQVSAQITEQVMVCVDDQVIYQVQDDLK